MCHGVAGSAFRAMKAPDYLRGVACLMNCRIRVLRLGGHSRPFQGEAVGTPFCPPQRSSFDVVPRAIVHLNANDGSVTFRPRPRRLSPTGTTLLTTGTRQTLSCEEGEGFRFWEEIYARLEELNVSQQAITAIERALISRRLTPRGELTLEKVCLYINRAAELCNAFGASASEMLQRWPTLLRHQPTTLLKNYNMLLETTGLNPSILRRVMERQPMLLCHNPSTITLRYEYIAELLGGTGGTERIAFALRRYPRLLTWHWGSLESNLQRLEALVAPCGGQSALRLVRCCPQLLLFSPESLAARLALLCTALAVPAGSTQLGAVLSRCPDVLTQKPSVLAARLQGLADLLGEHGGGKAGARDLAVRCPQLLALSPAVAAARAGRLASLLRLTPEQLVRLLLRRPLLLRQRPDRLEANLAGVCAAFTTTRCAAAAMAAEQPTLLTCAPAPLARRLAALSALVAPHPPWRDALQSMSPGSAAACAYRLPHRLLRLQYLCLSGLQSGVSFSTALMQKDQAFERRFPGFVEWSRNAPTAPHTALAPETVEQLACLA